MPQLPPELIDLVVSHLMGDRRALPNCALVCKAWTQPTRRRQLQRVAFNLVHFWSLQRFPPLVASPSSTITGNITHVYLDIHSYLPFDTKGYGVQLSIIKRAVDAIARLPRISQLELSVATPNLPYSFAFSKTQLIPLGSVMKRLTKISITQADFFTPGAINVFTDLLVNTGNSLHTLEMRNVGWNASGHHACVPWRIPERAPRILGNLRNLVLTSQFSGFLAWFSMIEPPPIILSIEVTDSMSYNEIKELGAYLRVFGHRLHDLKFAFAFNADHEKSYFSKNINIRYGSQLRTISFTSVDAADTSWGLTLGILCPAWIVQTLRQVTSAHLQQISISLRFPQPQWPSMGISISPDGWGELSAALPDLSALTKLRIVVAVPENVSLSGLDEALRGVLSLANRLGLLEITFDHITV